MLSSARATRLLRMPTSANAVSIIARCSGSILAFRGPLTSSKNQPNRPCRQTRQAAGLLCILPEIHGTAASIDGAAIIAEAVAPCSGEASQLVNSIKAPSEANCCRRHHLRQRQTVDPELNDRSQLGPGSHRRQLCNRFIKIRNHATGDEKPQAVSKTIQFARPIRDGECEWSAQRLWQISKNRDSQVIDLCRVVQDLGAVRISEQEHEPLIILPLQCFHRQPSQGSPDADRTMPQHSVKDLPRQSHG